MCLCSLIREESGILSYPILLPAELDHHEVTIFSLSTVIPFHLSRYSRCDPSPSMFAVLNVKYALDSEISPTQKKVTLPIKDLPIV